MKFILYFIYIFIPACPAAAALVTLFGRRAYVTRARLRHYRGPVGPGVAGLRVVLSIR